MNRLSFQLRNGLSSVFDQHPIPQPPFLNSLEIESERITARPIVLSRQFIGGAFLADTGPSAPFKCSALAIAQPGQVRAGVASFLLPPWALKVLMRYLMRILTAVFAPTVHVILEISKFIERFANFNWRGAKCESTQSQESELRNCRRIVTQRTLRSDHDLAAWPGNRMKRASRPFARSPEESNCRSFQWQEGIQRCNLL